MTFVQSDGIEWATAASVLQVSELAGLAHDFGQDLSGQVENMHGVRLRNGRRTTISRVPLISSRYSRALFT
jgi:hypothetical protein